MKNVFTKIGYMAFGSLLTLIGYHFGNIDNNNADAQLVIEESTPIVDEIRCRKLVIVGEDDTHRVALATNLSDRGVIGIYNEDGDQRIFLGVANDSDTGLLQIFANGSSGNTVKLGTDSRGGFMALWDKVLDKSVVQASITNKGEGLILTRDKTGDHTDALGSPETHVFQEQSRN